MYGATLLQYQMTTNSGVNRDLARVIIIAITFLIEVKYNFCMINELLI